jgi:hypothetical protein
MMIASSVREFPLFSRNRPNLMKLLAARLVLSLSLSCLLATGAHAQIVVKGVMLPDDVQVHEAERLEKRKVTEPWFLNLGVNEVLESNVSSTLEGTGDLGSYLQGAGGRSWTLPSGNISVIGNVAQSFYRQLTNSNTFSYGVGASASWAISPRLSLNVGDTRSTGYAQDAATLDGSGLLPPKLLTHLNTASAGVDYELSRRTRAHWAIAHQLVSFDSTEFQGGSTLSTAVNVGRQLSRSHTVGVSAVGQRALTSGSTQTQGAVLGTWQHAFGKGVSVTASGGLGLFTVPGQSGVQTTPAGSLGVVTRFRGEDTFGIRYDRSTTIEVAVDDLTHYGDSVTADYSLILARKVVLKAAGYYARSVFPSDPNRRRDGWNGSMMASYVITPSLNVTAAYGTYERIETAAGGGMPSSLTGRTVTASLTYGRKW